MAKQYIVTINDVPPSNNKFIGRTNRWEYQKVKKEWLALVKYSIKNKPISPLDNVQVHLHYTFPTKHRRDPDNYSGKMILDALVECEMIVDDSFNNIELKLTAGYEKGVSETAITIKEYFKE